MPVKRFFVLSRVNLLIIQTRVKKKKQFSICLAQSIRLGHKWLINNNRFRLVPKCYHWFFFVFDVVTNLLRKMAQLAEDISKAINLFFLTDLVGYFFAQGYAFRLVRLIRGNKIAHTHIYIRTLWLVCLYLYLAYL